MAVPKLTPDRTIWAKEAANTLPPLPATEPPQPAPEPAPVVEAPAPGAKHGKPRHK